jgi:hypothetical protein
MDIPYGFNAKSPPGPECQVKKLQDAERLR